MTGGSPDAGADVATSGDIARGSADGLDHGARGSADGSARGTQPLAEESVAAEAAPGVKRARGTKHRGGLKEQQRRKNLVSDPRVALAVCKIARREQVSDEEWRLCVQAFGVHALHQMMEAGN